MPAQSSGDRPARRPLIDEVLADQLLGRAQAEGAELLGPEGLLSQVTKAVLERALAEEMTGHLGDEKHDPAGRGSGNSRNGSTPKTLLTDVGAVDLAVSSVSLFRSGRSRQTVLGEDRGHRGDRARQYPSWRAGHRWHSDAGRCRDLVEQAGLDEPPPYRPEAGKPVYQIGVDDKIVWVAQRDLAGPLRELVAMTILTDRTAPRPARGGGQLRQAPPVSGEQAGEEAPGDVAGAQPEAMPARSPDGPGPGDRSAAAITVLRRGG